MTEVIKYQRPKETLKWDKSIKRGKELLSMRVFHIVLLTIILASGPVMAQSLESQAISPPSVNAQTTSTVAKALFAERNEDLHAVWVETTSTGSDVFYYKYKNASRRWSEGVALTQGARATDAAISGDYKGNLQVAWEDGGNIYHRMWNVTSEEWEPTDVVAENAYNPVVLCDRSPNAHFIWLERAAPGDGSPTFLSHRYLNTYGEWTNATPFSPVNAYSLEPGIALDQRNGLHVVWKMKFTLTEDYDMFHAYRRAGREWGPFERILEGSQRSISNPAAGADKDNYLHVVWEEWTDGVSKIYYRSWKGSWEDPSLVIDSSGTARNPVIIADDGLNVHLVWEESGAGQNPEIFYQRMWPLGIWSSPQKLTSNHASFAESASPRLEISPRTRDLHILWSELGTVFMGIWPGNRKEDASRSASKARSEISEVQRQPFVSPEADTKYEEALAAYEAGVQSLKEFDVPGANENFYACVDLLDSGHLLEEEYKEKKGKSMGMTLSLAGILAGAIVVIPWLILRNQEA